MPSPFFDHQVCLDPGLLELLDNPFRLLEGDELVRISMDDERRRVVRGDMGDW